MKSILLTGATGFLGSHLLESLILSGYNVVILKRSTSDLSRIEHLLDRVVSYDVDKIAIETAFEGEKVDVVIHTACHYGRKDDSISNLVESNLMYGLRVLDASLKSGTSTFINTDTMLQKELNNYTRSKKQLVEWLQQSSDKVQIINLKIEHMYGPKDNDTKFISWVLSQLRSGAKEINLTSGVQQRDFVHIEDVIAAYMLILTKLESIPSFSEFEVGTGKLISVREFLEKLKLAYEKKFGVSNTAFNFGVVPYRKGEMMSIPVDNLPLVQIGWKSAVSFEQGLEKLIQDIL